MVDGRHEPADERTLEGDRRPEGDPEAGVLERARDEEAGRAAGVEGDEDGEAEVEIVATPPLLNSCDSDAVDPTKVPVGAT